MLLIHHAAADELEANHVRLGLVDTCLHRVLLPEVRQVIVGLVRRVDRQQRCWLGTRVLKVLLALLADVFDVCSVVCAFGALRQGQLRLLPP